MVAILVVEDDLTTQFLMSEFIETLGYQCHIVSSGEDCVGILQKDPNAFDLILMDIHMPGMTGLDATRVIRADKTGYGDKIPIVAITADVSFHGAGRMAKHGINEVLPKPVDLNDLDSTIQRFAA